MAAVVGLAVLAALYVSHAREVSRLHEWAGRAPERSRQSVTAVRRRGRTGIWCVAVALVGLLVLGGAVTDGVTKLMGDHGGDKPSNPKRHATAVKPGNITVAVLNGTTVPGLAGTLRDRIAAAGFKKGAISNFPDQQLAHSVVEYAPGHEADAKAVSRSVGISQRQPVTERSHALAGDATVIVIAGADMGP